MDSPAVTDRYRCNIFFITYVGLTAFTSFKLGAINRTMFFSFSEGIYLTIFPSLIMPLCEGSSVCVQNLNGFLLQTITSIQRWSFL